MYGAMSTSNGSAGGANSGGISTPNRPSSERRTAEDNGHAPPPLVSNAMAMPFSGDHAQVGVLAGFPRDEADLTVKTVLGVRATLGRSGQSEEELVVRGVTSKGLRDKTFEYGLERVLAGLGEGRS